MNYIVTKQTKSKGIAILLVAIFGPLGMFYSTIWGGIIMTLIAPILIFILFLKGVLVNSEPLVVIAFFWGFLAYIICFVWAVSAVNAYNWRILNEANFYNTNIPAAETKEMLYENLERIKRLHTDKILNESDYEVQKNEYLRRLKAIDDNYSMQQYQFEFDKTFSNSKNNNVTQNWIIIILILALIASWIIIKFVIYK